MNTLIALLLFVIPAEGWRFSPAPVCTLEQSGDPQVEVTYDGTLYAIHLTRADGWPDAPQFSIRFEGMAGMTITTDRHVIDGNRLSVTDKGFGNVLNGMGNNSRGVAVIGGLEVPFSLADVTGPLNAFRGCETAPTA